MAHKNGTAARGSHQDGIPPPTSMPLCARRYAGAPIMAEVVNLRSFRKRKERADKETVAQVNRAAYGRTNPKRIEQGQTYAERRRSTSTSATTDGQGPQALADDCRHRTSLSLEPEFWSPCRMQPGRKENRCRSGCEWTDPRHPKTSPARFASGCSGGQRRPDQ